MRILLVGDSLGLQDNLETYATRALEGLGHTVIPFDCLRTRLGPVTAMPLMWRQRVRRFVPSPRTLWPGLAGRERLATNRALLETVEQERPELLLVLKGMPLLPKTLQAIKERWGIPRVNWFPDDPMLYLSDDIYPHYDLFFVYDEAFIEPVRQRGARAVVRSVLFACDPAIHRTLVMDTAEWRHWRSDVCFVGSYHPFRARFLEALASWDLAIWGAGWERLPAGSPLRRHVRSGPIPASEWVKAYNATTLALNISSHAQMQDPWVPMRPFEAMACGAPLLSTWNPAMAQLFQSGRDLDIFDTPEELCERVADYAADADRRQRMAQQGQALVRGRHTYRHRMEELLYAVQERCRAG